MHAVIAFRTRDPEVLSAWEAWHTAMQEHHERISVYQRSLDPTHKFNLYTSGDGTRVISLASKDGSPQCPPGWRRCADGFFRPDKRTKDGKAEAKRLETLNAQAPPRLAVKGMPDEVRTPNEWGGDWGQQIVYHCGIFVHDGVAYAYWGAFPDGYDESIWEELRPSEFYAAQEAFEAALTGKHAA